MPRQKRKIDLSSFHRLKESETLDIEESGYKFVVHRHGKVYYLYNKFKELLFIDKNLTAIKNYITEYVRL